MKDKKNILIGITGSIAAYKVPELIRMLIKKQYNVISMMTLNAKYFVTKTTLETITGQFVIDEMFPDNILSNTKHIEITDWADIILIAPATANIIGKIAAGIADDVVTTAAISSESPIIMAPAMNEKMWHNNIVQENVTKLKNNNFRFVQPEEGDLACGDQGSGRLATLSKIVDQVTMILS